MSDLALQRIESAIARLSEQQAQICARISALEGGVGRLAGQKKLDKQEVLTFLDSFRAGEALGEASLGAWLAVSDTACVRGGLRTAQQREGMHARLLEERLRELGAAARFEIPPEEREKAMKSSASTEKTDAQKLLEFVQRFPDIECRAQADSRHRGPARRRSGDTVPVAHHCAGRALNAPVLRRCLRAAERLDPSAATRPPPLKEICPTAVELVGTAACARGCRSGVQVTNRASCAGGHRLRNAASLARCLGATRRAGRADHRPGAPLGT